MNKFKIFFGRMEKANDDLTVGKIYPVIGLPSSDLILTDSKKLEPVPVGCQVLGLVIINTTRGLHDPEFHAQLLRAKDAFCAAMQPYYC